MGYESMLTRWWRLKKNQHADSAAGNKSRTSAVPCSSAQDLSGSVGICQ